MWPACIVLLWCIERGKLATSRKGAKRRGKKPGENVRTYLLVATDISVLARNRYYPHDPTIQQPVSEMPSKQPRDAHRPVLSIHRGSEENPQARLAPRLTQQRIAIAAGGDPTNDEIAEMAADTLRREGLTIRRVSDGDSDALTGDLLLLIGSGRSFPKLAELARTRGLARPRIVLWHQQPLPPPVLTRRADELGQRMRSAQWDDLLGRWAKGLSRLLPTQGRVRTMLQRLLAFPVRREFERLGGAEYGNVGWDDLCMIFEEAAWLSQTFNDPQPWIDLVACGTPTRLAFLRQAGIPTCFAPLGFHPAWGELGTEERDIDVLFVGTCDSPNRRSLVPDVLRQLRDWGFRTFETNVFPSGRQRTALLQRARVVLNVLRFPWEFPGPRLYASAACGALCVSNEAVQNEPFQPGLHFIRAPRTRMAESISWYLTHEEERRQRATRALQSFASDFSLLGSLEKLLEPTTQTAELSRAA